MTSLERVEAAVAGGTHPSGKKLDRVPISLLSFQNAARHAGISVAEYCQNPEKLAAAQIGYWEEFRHDLIDIENGIAAMAEAVGCTVDYAENDAPWIVKPAISSLEEVDRLQDVDLGTTPAVGALIEATRIVAQTLGSEVCVRGEADQGPFDLACEIVGTEQFLMALFDPGLTGAVRKLLTYAQRQVEKLILAQKAAGTRYTMIGESFAGPDVCSPALYKKYAFPFEKSLVGRMKEQGIGVGIHICGNATAIIEDMVATGAPYFELDYKIDRPAVAAAVRGKTAVFGTVDPSGVLTLGTHEEIRQAVKSDLELFAPDKRFVLAPGCTLPYSAPFENIHTFVEAGREFGVY